MNNQAKREEEKINMCNVTKLWENIPYLGKHRVGFGYSEEKFEFFLSYIIEGRILSSQLDNYIIKNIKFYLIIVTTEKLLPKGY